MILSTHPVELLRDGKGVYGIGVSKVADVEYPPRNIVFRPDRFDLSDGNSYGRTIFQMIPGGYGHGIFRHTLEERLRQVVHQGMVLRSGCAFDDKMWRSDDPQQKSNRKLYRRLRIGSILVINRLISTGIEQSANMNAIRQARRFPFRLRETMYRAGADNVRALQLIEAFPMLAVRIFYSEYQDNDRKNEAVLLINNGAPLRRIADLMGVPMAMRKVKPGAALVVEHCLCDWNPDLIHAFMPDSLPRMKIWLRAIKFSSTFGPEFVEWVAKHLFEFGNTAGEIDNSLGNISDWIRACDRQEQGANRGEQFVTRSFNPDMAVRTVLKLSEEWHEAVVAGNIDGPCSEFPEPWCDGAEVGSRQIVPLRNSAELFREGYLMRHCVGSYGDLVQRGEAYIFSVRENGSSIATIELTRCDGEVSIGQIRGSRNSEVGKEIHRVIMHWFRSRKEFHLPERIGSGEAKDRVHGEDRLEAMEGL